MSERYRLQDGRVMIEIAVRSPAQLFDARDPAPFRERDLDEAFVEYIVSAAEEFSLRAPLTLNVLIHEPPGSPNSVPTQEIEAAIREHFTYEAELARMKRVRVLKRGQLFLLVGLALLILCLTAAHWLDQEQMSWYGKIGREGLVIAGWVALWRPLDVILFEWWPLVERRRLFEKFAKSPIQIRCGSPKT